IITMAIQIHFHRAQKCIDEGAFDTEGMDRRLKCVENRIQTDPLFKSGVSVLTKPLQQFWFIVLMKTVYNLISEADKAINRMYGIPKTTMQAKYADRKRCTIQKHRSTAALQGKLVKKGFHLNTNGNEPGKNVCLCR